jgi:hypothetical protein
MSRIAWVASVALLVAAAGCGQKQAVEAESAAPAAPSAEALRPSPVNGGAPAKVRAFDWNHRIGIAGIEAPKQLRFAVPDDALPAGTLVTLVWLDEPQRLTRARILAPRDAPWTVAGMPVEGRAYELHTTEIDSDDRQFAIAITGDVGAPSAVGGKVAIDLDGDGRQETFKMCASSEGVHFTVWSGEPLQSPQGWHRYLYLGMDLEPTCTDAEAGAN